MKAIVTDMCNEKYVVLDSNELFGKFHCPGESTMTIRCDSCPNGYYPSIVPFTYGISSILRNFVYSFGGDAMIHIGDMSFVIMVGINTRIRPMDKSFKEALGICMTEDKSFWSKETLSYNSSIYMSEKDKFEEEE